VTTKACGADPQLRSPLELIADYECQTGENPLWHPLERRLYWTDIPRGRLFRYDPETGAHAPCYQGAPVGGFTVQADGGLLLFMAEGAIAKWHEGRLEYLVEAITSERGSRFNDVIADPAGRVFCGTMPTAARPGRLYRLDTDGALHLLLDGLGLPNGMGFTPDHRKFYLTDSTKRCVYCFDYDEKTGALANRREWLHTSLAAGVPDGLTVDAQGFVWSARWDGGAVYRCTSEGIEERRIDIPAKKVSSVAFGGADLGDLYVTTALAAGSKDSEGAGAGALFRVRPGDVCGLPEFLSAVKL
jgi:sugar lactone lactonase YvrE